MPATTRRALRAYLGMGLEQLHVLEQPAGADALPVLVDYLRDAGAQLVLTGSQAETGEGSGMLPFLLAEKPGLAAGGGAGRGGVDRERHRPGAASRAASGAG
jgi:electron transfer flavoprotein alpha/beta subunit